MERRAPWPGLVGLVVLCLAAGGLGSLATAPEIEGWYRALEKPAWTPPDGLFAPVWTTLYVLMAVAAWLAWGASAPGEARRPLGLFALQLALNVAWSWLFFALHRPALALAEVVVLWLAVLATTVAFFRRSRPAGWLMVPYLAWVGFAAALNLALWQLNA